jgi:transcriptional regulator with XRE-family HTH domain
MKVIPKPRSVHSADYQLLAQHLRRARIKQGLTQRDVAARLQKPASYPHKVENAERELNVIELIDYCAALNVDFIEFIQHFKQQLNTQRSETV